LRIDDCPTLYIAEEFKSSTLQRCPAKFSERVAIFLALALLGSANVEFRTATAGATGRPWALNLSKKILHIHILSQLRVIKRKSRLPTKTL
jgi:hypothetical protein